MSNNHRVLLEITVKKEFEDIGVSTSSNIHDYFEIYSAALILKKYELSYEEIESGITGGGLDGGADSLYLFVNGDLVSEEEDIYKMIDKYKKNAELEFIIIQSKYSNSFSEDVLIKFYKLSTNLFELELDYSKFKERYTNKVLNSFDLFRKAYMAFITKKPIVKIKYYYASKGTKVHDNVCAQAEELIDEVSKSLPNTEVTVDFIGAVALIDLAQQRINNTFIINFSGTPASPSGNVFFGLVSLADYYKFITDENGDLIKHIFESNVRDYQSGVTVNKEIQETLELNIKEDFWWLNNGVTITASEASTTGGCKLIVTDPGIVNGLQTSTEIFRYFSNNPGKIECEQRRVLVRVIVPENEEIRNKIIRATNSQTQIQKATLKATDPLHSHIEEYMKRHGLYYDRRKNYYRNMGKKPTDIVSMLFLSQCLIAVLLQKPDSARARPTILIEDDKSYYKLFNDKYDLKMYYKIALLSKKVDAHLRQSKKFSISEVTDIRFYVIYAVVAGLTSNIYPTPTLVAELNEDVIIDEELIESMAAIVYELYHKLGGDDQVAKGPELIKELKQKLERTIVTTK